MEFHRKCHMVIYIGRENIESGNATENSIVLQEVLNLILSRTLLQRLRLFIRMRIITPTVMAILINTNILLNTSTHMHTLISINIPTLNTPIPIPIPIPTLMLMSINIMYITSMLLLVQLVLILLRLDKNPVRIQTRARLKDRFTTVDIHLTHHLGCLQA